MCGLAGFFLIEGRLPEDISDNLKKMGEVLAHRGPDDFGDFLSADCGFVFRRLSIIDLKHGHQPMLSPSKKTMIVFNGEIYNFQELKRELEGLGTVFRTNSDAEVILVGYEIWGAKVVSKIRGMFAFVIYDLQKKSLFIARDHTGIKPLYYSMQSGCFIFASEIKAVLKFRGVAPEMNLAALPQYISFLWVPAPYTLFKNIYILEPGHMLFVSQEGIKKRRYWSPSLDEQDFSISEKGWMEIINTDLRRIVKEQMISDVPLGAFLSGGVDSSTIIAFMNQVSDDPVTTYTTGFTQKDLSQDVILSDLKYARISANILNVNYNEIILTPNVVDLLPSIIWHMDEPLPDPAAITTYLICKCAKEKCSVMLSGVGGDEIFGGYPRYIANLLAEKYHGTPQLVRKRIIKPGTKCLAAGSNTLVRNLKKFLKSADLPFEARYFGYLTYYSQLELRDLMIMEFDWAEIFDNHRQILEKYRSVDSLQSMMNLDLMTFLPNLNLMYIDKMSSAAAVEVRVPFLDHLFIEKIARVPGDLKIKRWKRKYILKKTAEKYLPKKLIWRKKAGFSAPIGAWLKSQAKDFMLDLLSEETVKKRGYFNYSYISNLIDNHLNGKEYNANQLWQLMALELWHQTFID